MEECIKHEMFNCATCSGEDSDFHEATGVIRYLTPWTDKERRIARNASLTTVEVAELIGRSVSNISAYRIAQLHMTEWAGNHHNQPRT